MKAIDRPFTKIIDGTTQFVIPVFQRDYRWSEAQCEQLWRDILLIAKDETNRGHFMGSVVYVSTGDTSAGFTRWLLIDGQQRLTTLTLLLAALRDHIVGFSSMPSTRVEFSCESTTTKTSTTPCQSSARLTPPRQPRHRRGRREMTFLSTASDYQAERVPGRSRTLLRTARWRRLPLRAISARRSTGGRPLGQPKGGRTGGSHLSEKAVVTSETNESTPIFRQIVFSAETNDDDYSYRRGGRGAHVPAISPARPKLAKLTPLAPRFHNRDELQ